MSLEHSRSLRLAAGVSTADERTLLERQEAALVVVSLDPALPLAELTARVLLTTFRRLPGRLALDHTGLTFGVIARLADAVNAVDASRPLQLVDGAPEDAAVRLAVADAAPEGVIRVVPDGYGAQLANDARVELVLGQQPNALGAVCAAALGAAEAFKHIVVDKTARRTFHRHIRFCPVTLSDDTSAAPPLPAGLLLDVALIGNGAIGTAVTLILAELRRGGRIVVCDPERYGPENRGTYSLGGDDEAGTRPYKVDLTEGVLTAAGYDVEKVRGKSTDFIARADDGKLSPPRIVITGLDSTEARRETQMLWPDHIIDAATGDTSLGLHHALPTGPCLRCFFPERQSGPDPLQLLADETGLPVSRLARGDAALTEEDLAGLTAAQHERLRQFVGRPVCGLADALGLTGADADGYLPSVPFVSQLAAALAVGRLIAIELGVELNGNFVQFDALHGPAIEPESRNPCAGCYCQQRQRVVRLVRRSRWRDAYAA